MAFAQVLGWDFFSSSSNRFADDTSSGSAALKALREGWDPFAGVPGPPSTKKPKPAATLSKTKKKKKKVDKQTGDCVAPVSRASLARALPTKLGRDDVYKKRDKKGTRIDRTKVSIEVNKNGVQGEEVAQAMRRAQEFANREKRSAIFLTCIAEYS